MEGKQESSWDPVRGLQTVAGQWRCGIGGGGPHWQRIAAPPPPLGPVPCWPLPFDPACTPPSTCWSPTPQWLRLAAHVGMSPWKERMPQGGTYCRRIRVKENLVFLKVLKLFGLKTSLTLLKIVFVGIPINIYHIRF